MGGCSGVGEFNLQNLLQRERWCAGQLVAFDLAVCFARGFCKRQSDCSERSSSSYLGALCVPVLRHADSRNALAPIDRIFSHNEASGSLRAAHQACLGAWCGGLGRRLFSPGMPTLHSPLTALSSALSCLCISPVLCSAPPLPSPQVDPVVRGRCVRAAHLAAASAPCRHANKTQASARCRLP